MSKTLAKECYIKFYIKNKRGYQNILHLNFWGDVIPISVQMAIGHI